MCRSNTTTVAPLCLAAPVILSSGYRSDTKHEYVAGEIVAMVGALGVYTYPDITVICGEPQLEEREKDTLLNPTVSIEIPSPSTARYDQGLKFQRYRHIPSFRDYLLIAQDAPCVEHYTCRDNDTWPFTVYEGVASTITLPSVGCALALADIYHRVTFG